MRVQRGLQGAKVGRCFKHAATLTLGFSLDPSLGGAQGHTWQISDAGDEKEPHMHALLKSTKVQSHPRPMFSVMNMQNFMH